MSGDVPESVDVPVVSADLVDLPAERDRWCVWPHWPGAVVRRLDEDRWCAVIPFIYTHAVVWGWIDDTWGYEDRWCYESATLAVLAAATWDGAAGSEPFGWHRHPRSGRRRAGDREWVSR